MNNKMTEIVQIKQAQELIAVVMGDNQKLIYNALAIRINTEGDLKIGAELLQEIKERLKTNEDKRTSMVKPINDGVKEINKSFKEVTEPLEEAFSAIGKKMLPVQQRVNKEREEAAEKIRAEREAELLAAAEHKADVGQDDKAEELVEMAINVKAKVDVADVGRGGFTGAKSSVTKRWTYEVTDIAALATAFPECVEVNKGLVRKLIAGGNQVVGLRVFQESAISVR